MPVIAEPEDSKQAAWVVATQPVEREEESVLMRAAGVVATQQVGQETGRELKERAMVKPAARQRARWYHQGAPLQ